MSTAGNNVLTTESIAIGYGTKVLTKNINITLHRGAARVIGGNGTGKTTLLKTLIGQIPELAGRIVWGTKTNIGYYSQSLDDLHPANEVHAEMRRVAPNVENVEIRSFLARFLFFGEDIFKKVKDLSGGEKGRLALAKLIHSQKNVLVLDEPTNHLDIPAREALESALDEFPGTVVTVSHDRFFLDRIATQMLSFEADGTVLDFNGNYTEFHDWKLAKQETNNRRPEALTRPAGSVPRTSQPTSTLSKNQRVQLEKRVKEIESSMPELEKQIAVLSGRVADPAIAADFAALSAATGELNQAELELSSLFGEWERAVEMLG